MIELLIELLANRLGVLILGVLFIIGGVYTWQTFRADVSQYDAAVGSEGRTVTGRVAWKNQERVQSEYRDDGGSTLVDYFTVEYEHEGESQRVKVYVDSDEYAARKEGDPIEVKYHPANLEYIVTPDVERESTLLVMFFTIVLIGIGVIIVLGIIISFF
jgi:hypothetical protein